MILCNFLLLRVEDLGAELPFLIAAGIGCAALELRDVGFPFGLTRKRCKTRHVALEIEVVTSVHNHEQLTTEAVYFHRDDSNLVLTGNDLQPHMAVYLAVLLNHLRIIYKCKCLAVTFHGIRILHNVGSDPIVHEEPEAEVVSDESDSVETDIENTASEVEGVNASTNTEPQSLQHSSETAPSAEASSSHSQPHTPREPKDLVNQGISSLSGLSDTLKSPEATAELINSIVEVDEETVSNVLQLLGKLFGGI